MLTIASPLVSLIFLDHNPLKTHQTHNDSILVSSDVTLKSKELQREGTLQAQSKPVAEPPPNTYLRERPHNVGLTKASGNWGVQ